MQSPTRNSGKEKVAENESFPPPPTEEVEEEEGKEEGKKKEEVVEEAEVVFCRSYCPPL